MTRLAISGCLLTTLLAALALFAQNRHRRAAAVCLRGGPIPLMQTEGFRPCLFGDTHVHSALSADAGGGGTTLMPRDMYRFARGEQVVSNTGQPVKMARPFDFYMLTEHTDGMGVITDIKARRAQYHGRSAGQTISRGICQGRRCRETRVSIDLIAQFSPGDP